MNGNSFDLGSYGAQRKLSSIQHVLDFTQPISVEFEQLPRKPKDLMKQDRENIQAALTFLNTATKHEWKWYPGTDYICLQFPCDSLGKFNQFKKTLFAEFPALSSLTISQNNEEYREEGAMAKFVEWMGGGDFIVAKNEKGQLTWYAEYFKKNAVMNIQEAPLGSLWSR